MGGTPAQQTKPHAFGPTPPDAHALVVELVREFIRENAVGLSDAGRAALAGCLEQLIAHGGDLPDEAVDRIAAISIVGVDPEWQLSELRRIVDDMRRRH